MGARLQLPRIVTRVGRELETIRHWIDLDDLDIIVWEIAGGQYVVPYPEDGPEYDIPALDRYCKRKGIKASALSDAELKQFEIPRKDGLIGVAKLNGKPEEEKRRDED